MSSKRRVVVSGMGAVSNIGLDAKTMWSAMLDGKSGAGTITRFEQDDQWPVTIAGEVTDFDASPVLHIREQRKMDRFCLMGFVAASEAAEDCGIDFESGDQTRRGVVIGSGVGGIGTIEEGHVTLWTKGPKRLSPFTVPKLMVNACAGHVSIRYKLRGANSATATACATGGHAIGTAFHLIRDGFADVVMAGGAEAAITPLCIGSFAGMKALSTRNDDPTRASRPFDRDRDGFLLAEGAAILVLEEYEAAKARGAKIYAEVCGYGTSGDAGHIAAPDEEGTGAKAAMRAAIQDAGLNLEDIDYINAHGTSTPLGDSAEVLAVTDLFGDHASKLAMSSTKSMTGHTLGAAGGIESVAVAMALRDGVMPPTINLDNPDEGFNLNLIPHEPQERAIRYGLNNSFGFGGHNVSVCFGKI